MGDVVILPVVRIERHEADEARERFLRHRRNLRLVICDLAMGRADPELQEFTDVSGYVAPPDDCA